MTPRRTEELAFGLYATSAAFALVMSGIEEIPLQRTWLIRAALVYGAAALLAAAALLVRRRLPKRRLVLQAGIASLVVVAATVLPLWVLASQRIDEGPGTNVQSEALMIEEGAATLVHGESPYRASYEDSPLGRWPDGTARHYPYPPGSLAFGLPRALAGPATVTDARVVMLVFSLAVAAAALAVARVTAPVWILVLMVLFALPTGARYAVGGGSDLPALALMLLSLALAARGRPLGAGVAVGLAVCAKHLALPLVPYLAAAARDEQGRPAVRPLLVGSLVSIAIVTMPFVLGTAPAFVEDVVMFPLGLSPDETVADSPTLGGLIAAVMPVSPTALTLALFVVTAIPALAWVLRRRCTPAIAATGAALITTLLIVFATAGRWGYLIYPVNLALWARTVVAGRPEGGAPGPAYDASMDPGSDAVPDLA